MALLIYYVAMSKPGSICVPNLSIILMSCKVMKNKRLHKQYHQEDKYEASVVQGTYQYQIRISMQELFKNTHQKNLDTIHFKIF